MAARAPHAAVDPPSWETARRIRQRMGRHPISAGLIAWCGVWTLVTGCGASGGQILYLLGVGRGRLVKAEFQLTSGPILILVDDPGGRITWPPARRKLVDDLAEELLRRGAAKKVIPLETVDGLRRGQPDFDRRGCREVGELAGAEQVLWVEVQSYFAEPQFSDVDSAAHLTVTVKVVNVLEKERRSRTRLWPKSPSGWLVAASVPGPDVARLKTRDAIAVELGRRLGAAVARLFCDHRLNDFEKPE